MWGIAGAIVLRTAFILAGIGAVARFAWVIPVFGAIVMAAGTRLALTRKGHPPIDTSVRLFQFVRRHAPTGLAALVVLETADLVFALDSLPAVLAVTRDPVIAIASKMLLDRWILVPTAASLCVIAAILALSTAASLLRRGDAP